MTGGIAIINNMRRLHYQTTVNVKKYLWSSIIFHHGYATEVHTQGVNSEIQPYEKVPGPKPFPVIGNMWRFLPFMGEYYGREIQEMHRMIHKKYGNIARFRGFTGPVDLVFIFHPDDVETTFRNEGQCPVRRGLQAMTYYRKFVRKDFYKNGGGVLVEDGEKWLLARSKANQPMLQPRISKRYIQPIGNVAQEFIDRLYNLKDSKDEMPADFINELFKWSIESIAFVALDTRLGCLVPNLPKESEPQKMIDAVGTFFECSFYLEIGPPIWKIFPTPTWKKFVQELDIFLEISNRYVEEAVERLRKRGPEGTSDAEPSVLERLLARGDPEFASIMAQDMLFGGVDTTSYSIGMAMYQLSKNQEKQEILFQEVKRFLPEKGSEITEQNLEEMKFLRACLKESARLSPIISGNLRFTTKEIVLSSYRIPKGIGVLMPFTISTHSEEFFPQHGRYIPERWLKVKPGKGMAGNADDFEIVKKGKQHPFAFLPFGFGPRSCIGRRFADLEMEILLAKIVRNFKIEYNYGEMKFRSGFLNTPKDPLRFKLVNRKE
ncbi:probable cytochrome P450 301a1, mitochondrial [Ischnura elegans]|uniref:probable cytochrome P450 301a1, mitochondrial n=1 Tax=Ischnura elegans TaxID=197161 RepID=UPI001ED8753A|nr:probable cytochrome P450 301a1, mitochondrial [Ischnura elegans]